MTLLFPKVFGKSREWGILVCLVATALGSVSASLRAQEEPPPEVLGTRATVTISLKVHQTKGGLLGE